MLFLSATPAEEISDFARNVIPIHDLADDGYEHEPHVTVLYGFHRDVRASEIESCVSGTGQIMFELGKISRFDTSPDYDVLKFDIESEQLHELNAKLVEAFEGRFTNDYPVYRPHLTLAYVKKGACRHLDDSPVFFGRKFATSTAVFSNAGAIHRLLVSL